MMRNLNCSLAILFALGACGQAAAQGKKPVQDPEVAAKAGELKKCVLDRKFSRDAEGVTLIDALLVKLQNGAIDKDKAIITKAFGTVLTKGKVRSPKQPGLYVAAVEALAYCESDGAKVLKKAFEGKRIPDKAEWVDLRARMLRSIGKTKDEGMVKLLIDEARRSPENALMAAAGEALGNYESSKDKIRKEIVSDLIKRWGELEELASQLGTGHIQAQNAKNTLSSIGGKWNETFAKLTRQNHTRFLDWQKWYNKNKGKKWK
ncbi:MAG: hypothetical protein NXI31_24615 [bacterium]|nr:hypothetical protein [bacterium]